MKLKQKACAGSAVPRGDGLRSGSVSGILPVLARPHLVWQHIERKEENFLRPRSVKCRSDRVRQSWCQMSGFLPLSPSPAPRNHL